MAVGTYAATTTVGVGSAVFSGSVGIETSPVSGTALSVNGGATLTGSVLSGPNTGGGNYLYYGFSSPISGAGAIVTGGAYPLVLGVGSGEFMRISTSGFVGIGTTTPTTALQVIGTATASAFGGGSASLSNLALSGTDTISFGADYTTTGLQSDVALNANSAIRYNGSSTATFYGIVAGAAGQILNLHNASTSALTLSNQSTSDSTLANRIITGTGSDLVMAANSSASLQYDGTAQR